MSGYSNVLCRRKKVTLNAIGTMMSSSPVSVVRFIVLSLVSNAAGRRAPALSDIEKSVGPSSQIQTLEPCHGHHRRLRQRSHWRRPAFTLDGAKDIGCKPLPGMVWLASPTG